MARTPSKMIALGSVAPDFNLLDTIDGNVKSKKDVFGSHGTVVMFICNHCPFVVHVNPMLVQLANEYQSKNINWVAISSNDSSQYPEDAPDKMKTHAAKEKYPFPYLYDETQEVAKAYGAACTPDFFVYNEQDVLVYRGQLDDSRPQNGISLTGNDLRKALDSILQKKPVTEIQKPSIGCNIKWKVE